MTTKASNACELNPLDLDTLFNSLCVFLFQDLKSEKHRAQMGVARAILEKSTMMLLTTSKVRIFARCLKKQWRIFTERVLCEMLLQKVHLD